MTLLLPNRIFDPFRPSSPSVDLLDLWSRFLQLLLVVLARSRGKTRVPFTRRTRPHRAQLHPQLKMTSQGSPNIQTHALIAGATAATILAVFAFPLPRLWVSEAVGAGPAKLAKRRKAKVPFEHWVDQLRTGSFTRLLDAFGPDGKNAPGCKAGVMIASPSRPGGGNGPLENADYFYQWTRTSQHHL